MKICPLCHSASRELIYRSTIKAVAPSSNQYLCTSNSYGLHGPIYKCKSCQLLYIVDKAPIKSILNRYQEAIDPLYLSQELARIKTFSRSLKVLNKLKPSQGNLLDIGAYTGVFLSQARKSGWKVAGIEPSHWAVTQAKSKYDLKIKKGLLAPNLFPANKFDVITMWDVIEHFTEPLRAILISRSYLKTGGILAITTIDVESIPAKILGKNWPWFMRMHRVYFSKKTLSKLLAEAGFKVISISPHVRYVSLGYLISRFRFPLPKLAQIVGKLINVAGIKKVIIPFYIGDLFDLYAIKK